VLPVADEVGAGWHHDPTGRHQWRWWDGNAWTEHVASGGVASTDPIGSPSPTPATENPWVPSTGWAPTPPPGSRANGLALAAMIVGIVGAFVGVLVLPFFLAIPLGATALGLGVAGRRRAADRPDGRGRGQATSGIVLGSIAMALGVLGACLVFFVIDFSDDIGGSAAADTYEIDPGACSWGDGEAVAEGDIENTSGGTRSFEVVVDFEDEDGDRVAQGSDDVDDLAPNESESFRVTARDERGVVDSCRVTEVNAR
jgi:uncharacterized membrane protein YeaQ/YmgE (transglycosylase-associated protein family)